MFACISRTFLFRCVQINLLIRSFSTQQSEVPDKISSQEIDVAFLDKEYSPMINSKRFPELGFSSERVIEDFINRTEAQTRAARARYKVRENIRYGGLDDNQLVDIYYKDKENDTPIFVFIHGGYWQMIDKSSSGSFVGPLVEHGYRVIVVSYNLCPKVSLEQLTQEMDNFYEWLFNYANQTNASKISLCGHSAGANLVASVLGPKLLEYPEAKRITTLFLIGGVYDLRVLWKLESVNPKNIFSLNASKATQLSPICWDMDSSVVQFIKENGIRIYVLVTENNSDTFKQLSKDYAQKLIDLGLKGEYKIFERYDHFDIIEDGANKDSDICQYIFNKL